MKNAIRALFAAACVAAFLAPLPARALEPTPLCNSRMFDSVILRGLTPEAAARIQAVVDDPKADPALYEALWGPRGLRNAETASPELVLDFAQDLQVVAAAMRADPRVASLGLASITTWEDYWRQFAGFAVGLTYLTPHTFVASEYHDPVRDQYYWSTAKDDDPMLGADLPRAGWVKTGERITVLQADSPNRFEIPVWEFRQKSNGARFFTTGADECGTLRRFESEYGWKLVNRPFAFFNQPARDGSCSYPGLQVHRLRNGKDDDPAHRYTTKASIVQDMVARGWVYEGVFMCAWPAP